MSDSLSELTVKMTAHLALLGDQFLNAAEEDNARFAEAMATDLAAATLMGDQAYIDEILGQARSLAEKHRVNFSDSAWAAFIDMAGSSVSLVSVALQILRGVL